MSLPDSLIVEFDRALRTVLGEPRFAECVAAGEAMELAQAVQYARGQIQHTRLRLDDQP